MKPNFLMPKLGINEKQINLMVPDKYKQNSFTTQMLAEISFKSMLRCHSTSEIGIAKTLPDGRRESYTVVFLHI